VQTDSVLAGIFRKFQSAAGRILKRARTAIREASRPLPLVTGFLVDVTRSRKQLLLENALLRQQLIVACRKFKRPTLKPHERSLIVLLSHFVSGWRGALLLVKPETVLRWHRKGFRFVWKWKSRKRKPAESKLSAERIALIRRMAAENILSKVNFSGLGSPSLNARFNGACGERVHQRCRMVKPGRRFSRTTRFGPATSCRSTISGFGRYSLSS